MNEYARPSRLLNGATSRDLAYTALWPCGWNKQCYKLHWIERRPHKMRLVTQTSCSVTTEPLVWNTPKLGKWHSLVALYLDESGKVQHATWTPTDGDGALLAFCALYEPTQDEVYIDSCLKAFAKGRRRLERLAELREKEAD